MSEKDLQPVNNQDSIDNKNVVDEMINEKISETTDNLEQVKENVVDSTVPVDASAEINSLGVNEKKREELLNPSAPEPLVTEIKETSDDEKDMSKDKSTSTKESSEDTSIPVDASAEINSLGVHESKREDLLNPSAPEPLVTEIKEVPTEGKKSSKDSEEEYDLMEDNKDIPLDDDDDDDDDDIVEEQEEDFSAMTREELINRLHDLLQTDDIVSIKSKVAGIKVAFHEKTKLIQEKNLKIEGPISSPDDETEGEQVYTDPLEERFIEVFNIYKEKRKQHLDQLEEDKKQNLEAKQKVLEDIRTLIESNESLKSTYDKFNELQEQWKAIGQVPRTELNNLWQNYHFLVEKFFDKVKISRELRDLDYQKNLEAKIQLCEKTEELLLEKSIIKSFKKLQEYHQMWREIGLVPSDKRDELWERFKTATDKINARRKEHYLQLKDQQDSNYAAKIALIEEAKSLTTKTPETVKQWHNIGDQLNELFNVWRTIGPAPKSQNDQIWAEFKGIMDEFYTAKKAFFVKLKEEQYNNYNLKLDLCTKAEALKDSSDWGETTRALINLQKEWKTIGPVPRKMSEKIWQRFRGACDEFFNRKEEFFADINEKYGENLIKKNELIEKINNLQIEDNPQETLNQLKALQREWMSIGFVDIKEKNDVNARYKKALDNKFDALRDKGVEVSKVEFKNKIDIIKDNPNANRLISQEKRQLINRVQKLKDDLALWENNIGFLSNSKNSMLLKAEFEKKINKAKQDIALLEAKINYIDEQE